MNQELIISLVISHERCDGRWQVKFSFLFYLEYEFFNDTIAVINACSLHAFGCHALSFWEHYQTLSSRQLKSLIVINILLHTFWRSRYRILIVSFILLVNSPINSAVDCCVDLLTVATSLGEVAVSTNSARADNTDTKMYQLDDSVQVWSDFLCPHLHPRSIHLIDSYQYDRLILTWFECLLSKLIPIFFIFHRCLRSVIIRCLILLIIHTDYWRESTSGRAVEFKLLSKWIKFMTRHL